ncbi:non-reducing end beta-L-arabinofuranosidase [Abditibacteriota bacterium]|nr:non-reducing end beta-L-arabinofuranosidase [Abditibacteriota bacterium]
MDSSSDMTSKTLLATATVALACNAGAQSKITPAQNAVSPSAVHNIGGFVGQRMADNRENYLEKFDINKFVQMVEDAKARDWWWIGEQPGKWLESASWSAKTDKDPALEAKTRAMLARLEAAQKADGYMGITDSTVRTPQQPLRGMDPYELYFTLHGLITASQQLNDPKALEAAKKLGDYFVATIGPGKAEFWPSDVRPPQNHNMRLTGAHSQIAGHTVHYGFEGTLLIDPMLRLYQVTGDQKYLTWSQWVVSNMDKWSGWDTFSRLDDVAAGKIGVNDLQPYVHSHTFQMNFLGLLRLYQITGDASLLRKVEGAWSDIIKRQMYITGGVSVGEHYESGNFKPASGNVVETCASMSWLQLNEALLELTGDPKYGDVIEKLLVNHVFAAQTGEGDSFRYHTPPNGTKPQGYYHGPDCCTSSGPRMIAMLPEFFYSQKGDVLFVNQFVASTADFALPGGNTVSLVQQTRYPETESVTIAVNPKTAATFSLSVRIPAWCAAPTLGVNGKATPVKAGTYATLTRKWKAGDKIELALPMTLRWQQSDGGEQRDEPVAMRPYALMRGPVVYALDTVWWDNKTIPAPSDVASDAGVNIENAPRYALVPTPTNAVGPTFEVPVTLLDGSTLQARMLPFANVGTWYRPGQDKPRPDSISYSYAVWLNDKNGVGFERSRQAVAAQRELEARALDFIRIGEQKSEDAHGLTGQSNSGAIFGKSYRDSTGTFSYQMHVSPDSPSVLVATYWGGDNGRAFDIFVNDRKIATQTLANNKPGEFFEVKYPIPFDLIDGKTNALGQKVDTVTVKFTANKSIVGGLYGLRTEFANP